MVKKFKLENFLKGDEKFHIARVEISGRNDLELHCHDYAEIFWIENGKGVHHINGQAKKLYPGDLVMIRPEDEHTFSSKGAGMILMNVAFPQETLTYLRKRYFRESSTYFWTDDVLPYRGELDIDLIHRLSQRTKECVDLRTEHLQLDALLLFIFRTLTFDDWHQTEMEMPEWLVRAIRGYNTPRYFKAGAKGFAGLCDKNIDYVNRIVKKHLNKTLSELVRDLRLSFAARQLMITSTPIKIISQESGYPNLGHFYSVFKAVYHQTPSHFRKVNQTIN